MAKGDINSRPIKKIFDLKRKFHLSQAGLPVEKKIGILVELQKWAMEVRKKPVEDYKRIWKIN